ncbi:hypothetical protein BCV69DRAFT_169954 [Microstroma glucosiphilum]|uniref:RNI-like protein n=1 Tax=Pseudomicrostroma glucosiphilum TaxID=1684307 RepID=A0A316UE97_9BASI|nr:hypothetical protein BCV69DRAFT_169954 [Pseudomicrostroma glucosiphilum]PWN21425.1 hypothetical protein BCV69DRAFT_169954 [Pseudomicrostroma glucosiphilum]
MAAAPRTAGADHPNLAASMDPQSSQSSPDEAFPFPSGNSSAGNARTGALTSSTGKERSEALSSQHLTMAKSTRPRQRTASDGLLDDLFCDPAAGHDGSIPTSEIPDELYSPSEGKMTPVSPFFPREGWAIMGQSPARHHRRRSSYAMSSHTRGTSSFGAASDLDYFGSSSFASTAPTSVKSMSPVRGKGCLQVSQSGQENEAYVYETTSTSAHQSMAEQHMPGSSQILDDRHIGSEAERAADEGHPTEPALLSVPSDQSLPIDVTSYGAGSSSSHIEHESPVPTHSESIARVSATSDDARRQSVRLPRSDSAPLLFASEPGITVSRASTPAHPTFERSITPGGEIEAMTSYDQARSSPRRPDRTRPFVRSLTERPSFLKPSFWRKETHASIRAAESRTWRSTPPSLDDRRPSTPSSLRFSRATFRRAPSVSSSGSSSRRFSAAAKSLFTRSESRSSEGSRAVLNTDVASESVSRPQVAEGKSLVSPAAPVEAVVPSHLLASRRPTLLRAAVSSPLGASTAVTPLNSAGAKSERDVKLDNFGVLPRELQVHILTTLIKLHVSEQEKNIARGLYRGHRARETKYVGLEAAMKELIRLSRVSKSWMALALDGQLWTELKTLALPGLSRAGLLKLAQSAGSFVREIDATGMRDMNNANLSALTGHLRGRSGAGHASTGLSYSTVTNLTCISLRGLQSISTSTLNYLLSNSPYLISAHLSDLAAVTNDTCIELARCCPQLQVLDVSRCVNVDGEGLEYLQHLTYLQVIKATGIKQLDATVMGNLARSLTCLQTLDLNYSDLTDACLSALTEHAGPASSHARADSRAFFELTASQSRSSGKDRQYRALLPALKHLAVSSTLITDRGLLSLAYGAVPHLEVLEIAHNRGIRDGGLVTLLTSAPYIRRLDFEGLIEISDKTLKALTPTDEADGGASRRRAKQAGPLPGSQLTHLLLSQCRRLHTGPMIALIKACPNLHHLEVDDTGMDDAFALRCLKQMSANSRLRLQQQQQADADAKEQASSYCLSMIDCRILTRPGCNAMLATNVVRPRLGRRGFRYNPFEYGDCDRPPPSLLLDPSANNASFSTTEQTAKMLEDECNEERVCVKTFWFWQAIDAKERKLRKREKKSMMGRKKMLLIGGGGGDGGAANGRSGGRNGSGSGSGSGSSSPLRENGSEGFNGTESAVRGLSRALLGGGSGSGSGHGNGNGNGIVNGAGYGLGFSRGNRLGTDGRVTPGLNGNGARGRAAAHAQLQAEVLAMDNQGERTIPNPNPLLRWSRLASGLFAAPSSPPSPFPEEGEGEGGRGMGQRLGEEDRQGGGDVDVDGDHEEGEEGGGGGAGGGEATRGEQALCVIM